MELKEAKDFRERKDWIDTINKVKSSEVPLELEFDSVEEARRVYKSFTNPYYKIKQGIQAHIRGNKVILKKLEDK